MSIDLITIAADLTADWRASDGGLTEAASDVRHAARWAQAILGAVARGEMDRGAAIEDLNDALLSASTGSESDVIEAALAAV